MANFNKVMLMGNLTRDIEMSYTPSNTAVARLGMAINRQWTGQDGQKREETCFVDLTAFGRQAEILSKYLKKGDPLFVEGRLHYDQWDDKQTGQRRSKLKVVVENFQFMPRGGGGGQGGGGGYDNSRPARGGGGGQSAPPPAPEPEDYSQDGPPDDDIPF